MATNEENDPRESEPSAETELGLGERTVMSVIRSRVGSVPQLVLRSDTHGGNTPVIRAASDEVRAGLPAGRHNYQMFGEIARGGMGVVLKGHDTDLGRDVAVKVLHAKVADDPMMMQRFVEEAQIGGQLQHPGIVPVYELGLMADMRPYFTMKLIKGRTLEKVLSDRAEVGEDRRRLLSIFESIAQTMSYAHSRGVIHRDLKPSNVMLGAFGEVQLVDWGLAKVLSSGTDRAGPRLDPRPEEPVVETVRSSTEIASSVSIIGSVMGTPPYMSPEQANGEVDEIDERTDVFSLGAVLMEILTGRAPYVGKKDKVLAMAKAGDLDRAYVRLDVCGADAELVELAKMCLSAEARRRPRDAGEVATRIGSYLAGVEERARQAQIEAAEARVQSIAERRARRLTLGLAASIVIGLVIVGGFAVSRERDRAGRRARMQEGVSAALGEANYARGRSGWVEARSAIERARTHLQAGGADVQLAASIATEEHKLDQAEKQYLALQQKRLRSAAFLAEIEAIRARVGRTTEQKILGYRSAFAELGIDVEGSTEDEVVEAIHAIGLEAEMARALDDWSRSVRSQQKRSTDEVRRLLQLALTVDGDPLRARLRRALLADDKQEISSISHAEQSREFSGITAVVISDALWLHDEWDEAFRVLHEAEARDPSDFHVQVKLAVRNFNRRDYDGAFPHLKAALALEPDSPWVLTTLGIVLQRRGQLQSALANCRRAVEVDADNAYAQHYLGVMLDASGEHDQAVEAYRHSVASAPEYVFAIRRLGSALAARGEHHEAIEWYRRALEVQPDSVDAMNSLAWHLATAPEGARDVEQAMELSKRALGLERDASLLNTRGVCLYRAGEFAQSLETLLQSVELAGKAGPEDSFFLSMAYAQLGEDENARDWYDRGDAWMKERVMSLAVTEELSRFRSEAAELVGVEPPR